MGNIPASGFITRLYTATVSTVFRYGKKKYVNRAKNRLERLHFLCEPHSLAKYEYEFFLEHFIHNNARGITILSP